MSDKKIEDYLHLYLRCEVKCPKLSGWIYSQKRMTLTRHFWLHNWEKELIPILRPLSDMSEEEKLDLAKMHDNKIEWSIVDGKPTGRENIGIKQIMEFEGDMFLVREIENNLFGDEREGNIAASNISNFELTRYFLSKHFDLFNLIPDGLAIDKTTLK